MNTSTQQYYTRYKKYATDLRRFYDMPAVKTSLSVVLSLFIAALFVFFALRPTFVTITGLKKTITESEDTLAKMQSKAATLQQISQIWDTIKVSEVAVDNTIPPDGPRYEALSKTMEIVAQESQTTLTSTSIGGALAFSSIIDPYSGDEREVINMPFTVGVTGTYPQISAFLNQLALIDRLLSLDTITYTKDTKTSDNEEPLIAVTLSGNVHYIANPSMINPLFSTTKSTTAAPASEVIEE